MGQLDRRQAGPWLGLIAWCGLLTVLSYATVLRLPLITDDWTQLPYAAAHSIAEIWQSASGLTYYRPLAFTIWKVLYVVLGHHDDVVLHGLNFLMHFVNGILVGVLASYLWLPRNTKRHVARWRSFLSAGLFIVFPFSFDAVVWIAAMMHPLMILLVLLSVLSYVKARETHTRRWVGLGLITALLAPFVHENGVLTVPLILAVELTWLPANDYADESIAQRLARIAVWLIPVLIWWLIWRAVPVARGPESLQINTAEMLWRNIVYFAQGPAYPLTWLGGLLSEQLSINNTLVAVGLTVLALGAALFIQWRTGIDRRTWLPWLWIALTAAPTVLFLDYRYVSSSPRMFILMSVGAAWLWADVLWRLTVKARATLTGQRVSQAGVAVLAGALLIQNVAFIHDRLQPWELGGEVVRQIVARTETANAQGQLAVFINLPAWLASSKVMLATGQDGIGLLSTYYPLESIVTTYSGQPSRAASLKQTAIQTQVPYYVGLRDSTTDWAKLAESGGQVFVTRYKPEQIEIQPAGALKVVTSVDQPIARFDRFLALDAGSAPLTSEGLQVALTWHVTKPLADETTVFVHVLDANGQLIAQADGDPIAGTYPFSQWPIGLMVRDIRLVHVSNAATVRVGVYSRSSGERLSAVAGDGTPLADNAVTLDIH